MSKGTPEIESMVLKAMKGAIERDDVKTVIGWCKGSFGLRTRPLLAYDADDLSNAVYNPLCASNPTTYIPLEKDEKPQLKRGESPDERKTAVVLRGCETRSLTVQLQEHVITRESLHVIGVPCRGVVDRKLLAEMLGGEPDNDCELDFRDDELVFVLNGKETVLQADEVLLTKCRECRYPEPLLFDELIDAPARAPADFNLSAVSRIEEMDSSERFTFWQEQFDRCIRCNACRNACPQCSCPDCILERLDTPWVRRENTPVENWIYHFTRAYHLIGRCTYCGECERVCPMDIPLLLIYKKLQKESAAIFDFEAGVNLEVEPLFSRAAFNELEGFGDD